MQRAGQRGGSLRAEGRGTASAVSISPPTPGITVVVLCIHRPPQWVTTVQQAFKLDREQQLSTHTNRGADSFEAGLQTLKWPLSKNKTVGFNHDSGETEELVTRRH